MYKNIGCLQCASISFTWPVAARMGWVQAAGDRPDHVWGRPGPPPSPQPRLTGYIFNLVTQDKTYGGGFWQRVDSSRVRDIIARC